MSHGPNMRELMKITESYHQVIAEESICQECGDRYDSELADSKHPELCISCDDKKSGTSFDFGFEDDIAIEDAVPADRFVGDDFGPPTNMCPDCEGTGEGRSGFDPNFPGLGYDCKRCNGQGQISEDSDMPGFGYDKEEDEEEDQHYDMKNAEKEKFKGKVIIVTDLYDGDVYGILNKKRFMISSPLWRGLEGPGEVTDDEVEVHSPEFNLNSKEKDFLRRWHLSIINEEFTGATKKAVDKEAETGEEEVIEDKPYATMKDSPDKYLFRKDGKQKLVGSANNEPENGEEELEETDMDKFIREMQIAAGIIVAEDEAIEEETVDEEEVVDEGKLPDALKKHQFGAKDDDDKDDDDKDDDDKDDDKEEVDEDVINWMKRFDRISPTLNEDCPTDPDKNDDGDCSPFTHADDNVDMVREDDSGNPKYIHIDSGEEFELIDVEDGGRSGYGYVTIRDTGIGEEHHMSTQEFESEYRESDTMVREDDFIEDLLLAPKDKTGPEVDEEGRKKDPFAGVDTSFSHEEPIDVDDFSGPELDHLRHPDDIVHDSGPELDHLRHPDDIEEGPGEFDHDPDAMIDVGDEEDYKVYDFNDEFEAMLGGSSDPVDGRRAGSMYEMNDLRRLAGLEQVIEDEKYEAAFNENSQESPIKALRQILQAEGIKTGRGYNDKNVGNRKIRIYTDRGLVKRAGNRKGPTPGRSIKDIEALVTAGMEKAGYQVQKVRVFPGMNKNSPNYFVGGGFDARMYPNVAVWLDGDPVGSRYQKKLDEFAPIIGAIAGGVARGAAGVARGVAGATKSVVGGIAGVAAEMGGDDDVEEGFPNSDFPDADVIAYEIDDERAYYVMADALGANLDFGPEDEILVPAQYNDQVVLELEKAGFEQGKDFWVAGEQYEADLQNGYDDRKFSDGQDYFPKGAQNQPSSDLGPSASSMADNPMSNKMRMVKKDDVYETMKLAYRRFRKA